ncbi:uncharacterized protein LOC116357818 isoform X2 [Oncorhynchus kisutch]|uniref:uncharacterized protein LOC116357818 isoform X2 n=1 Tax=Oncorhynchus kisutch TaxID=8019 RepID=UPI0012DBCCA7|nr:uncharacterized protein LOC116357818 isoform X2 [Oncorhynchus kisutch]
MKSSQQLLSICGNSFKAVGKAFQVKLVENNIFKMVRTKGRLPLLQIELLLMKAVWTRLTSGAAECHRHPAAIKRAPLSPPREKRGCLPGVSQMNIKDEREMLKWSIFIGQFRMGDTESSDPQKVLQLHHGCITTWYCNSSASDHKALQRVVRMAQYVTGAKLPAIQDLYNRRQRKALKMAQDSSH